MKEKFCNFALLEQYLRQQIGEKNGEEPGEPRVKLDDFYPSFIQIMVSPQAISLYQHLMEREGLTEDNLAQTLEKNFNFFALILTFINTEKLLVFFRSQKIKISYQELCRLKRLVIKVVVYESKIATPAA